MDGGGAREGCANATREYLRRLFGGGGGAIAADAAVRVTNHDLRRAGNNYYYDDSANSYKYIIFVLVIYAVSFMALMVKYFWKSHEGKKYENLYEEYVKRDGFKVVKISDNMSLPLPICFFLKTCWNEKGGRSVPNIVSFSLSPNCTTSFREGELTHSHY